VVGNVAEDTLLEESNLLLGEGVGLGNDGDEVDLGVQALHELNVDGLEPAGQLYRGFGSTHAWPVGWIK